MTRACIKRNCENIRELYNNKRKGEKENQDGVIHRMAVDNKYRGIGLTSIINTWKK